MWFHGLEDEDRLTVGKLSTEVFQDSEGFTWFGTIKGLYRFDGRTIKAYYADAGDPNSIFDDEIYGKFFEDKNQNLWFCTSQAINCYQRESDDFVNYQVHEHGVPINDSYQAIYLERDSFLWLRAGTKQFYRYNIFTAEQNGPLGEHFLDIFVFPGVDDEGNLKYLFVTDDFKSPGIEVFEVQKDSILINHWMYFDGSKTNQPALKIHTVFLEGESIWLSTNQGIAKWNLNDDGGLLLNEKSGIASVNIKPFDSRHFIVSTFGDGLFLFNKQDFSFTKLQTGFLNDPNFDLSNSFGIPYFDNLGNWWFPLDEEGVAFTNFEKN